MVTNPAKAKMGLLSANSRLECMLICCFDTLHDDPYRNLIEAIDNDVRLTVVQGKAVFMM